MEGECGREQAGSGRESREGWDGKEDMKRQGEERQEDEKVIGRGMGGRMSRSVYTFFE